MLSFGSSKPTDPNGHRRLQRVRGSERGGKCAWCDRHKWDHTLAHCVLPHCVLPGISHTSLRGSGQAGSARQAHSTSRNAQLATHEHRRSASAAVRQCDCFGACASAGKNVARYSSTSPRISATISFTCRTTASAAEAKRRRARPGRGKAMQLRGCTAWLGHICTRKSKGNFASESVCGCVCACGGVLDRGS